MSNIPGATHWHRTVIDGKVVLWIDDGDGTGARVCSVHDPAGELPARRMLTGGGTESLPGEPAGLTVYGTHKLDRPTFDAFVEIEPIYGHLVNGIMEGRGLTDSGVWKVTK